MTTEKINKLFANYSFKARSITTNKNSNNVGNSANLSIQTNVNTKQFNIPKQDSTAETEFDETRTTIDSR